MDFDQIFSFVKENPFLLIVAYFLFKDKIDALFTKKPEVVPLPVPGTGPVVVPVVSPNDTPLIDAITKLLPIILPVLLQQAVQAQAAAAKKE